VFHWKWMLQSPFQVKFLYTLDVTALHWGRFRCGQVALIKSSTFILTNFLIYRQTDWNRFQDNQQNKYNLYLTGPISPRPGASSGCGCRRRPKGMEGGREYIAKSVAANRKGVALQLRCGWEKKQLVMKCYTLFRFLTDYSRALLKTVKSCWFPKSRELFWLAERLLAFQELFLAMELVQSYLMEIQEVRWETAVFTLADNLWILVWKRGWFSLPFIRLFIIMMAIFWVVAPCRLVEVYRRFRGACCLHHQDDHDATTQKTAISILTAVRTSNLT
jgi:hypothetical protein